MYHYHKVQAEEIDRLTNILKNMDGEDTVVVEPKKPQAEEAPAEKPAEASPELTSEEIEKLRKEAEDGRNYKTRAEKAEALAKSLEAKAKDTAPSQDLTTKDVLYLSKAEIHPDDLDEVLELSKLKKIGVKEAHEYLSPILAVRNEERTTANATNTNASRRPPSKISGDDLLAKALKTGEVPDSDEGMAALAKARLLTRNRH